MRAALRFRYPREQTPVDQVACDEIRARIPAMITALGHAEAVLFLERCIASIEQDRERSFCEFLKT
jgi:hypothetical protein